MDELILGRDEKWQGSGFHFACEKGHLDLLYLFLNMEKSALYFLKDKLGRSGLHRSILSGKLEVC